MRLNCWVPRTVAKRSGLRLCVVLLAGMAGSAQATVEAGLTQAQVATVVDTAAETIRAQHFDAVEAERIANELLLRQVDQEVLVDPAHLAEQLTQRLRAISGDRHFRVLQDPEAAPAVAAVATAPDAVNESGIVSVSVDAEGIGHLVLSHFPANSHESRSAYAAAMATLVPARALLIDLRANRGGDPVSVAEVMSYLFARPRFVSMDFISRGKVVTENVVPSDRDGWHLSERAPIAVLVSARTFSGGEALAYDLQAYRRATVVGETSGGAANPTRLLELPFGLAISVPYLTPRHRLTGANWEQHGVTPDIACTAGEAEGRALAMLHVRLPRTSPATR